MFNPDGQQVSILVVEDNMGDFLLIDEYLKEQGFDLKVDHADSYLKAREYLKRTDYTYDAILLDLTLPDMSGEALIEKVVSMEGKASTIVLTGYSDMDFSIKSLNLGVSDYIVKDELNSHVLWKSIRYSIERNLASKKLQESESRYRHLFESNPSSIIIWELESCRVLDSNNKAESKYGYSKEQFKQLKIDDIQPIDQEEYLRSLEEKFSEGGDFMLKNNVINHKKSDGELFLAEVRGHFIEFQGKTSVLLLINDVTDKVEMQERLIENTIRAEEEERSRIAKELHDGIVQQLAACSMFTQNIYHELEDHNKKLAAKVDYLYELLVKTTIQTRDISHNLKSAEFELKSLSNLLTQLIKQLSQAGDIDFKLNNHLDLEEDVNSLIKTNVYRSIQELCNNIIKHSNASWALLTVEKINKKLFITIKDDGTGFDFINQENFGVGIQNVNSRIQRLGGEVQFSNNKSGGLQIDLEIPLINKKELTE